MILKVIFSKCAVSYPRRLQRDLLWKEGRVWEGKGVGKGIASLFHCVDSGLDLGSGSSLPVAIAYLIAAWTAFMSGCHRSVSERDLPPRKKGRFPHLNSMH